MPNYAIIHLLSYCNLNCLFCETNSFRKKLMPKEKVFEIVDKLKGSNLKYLILTGGEVTLHKDLLEIVDYIKRESTCRLIINTNGVSLNKNLIRELVKRDLNLFKISIHSFEPGIHDKITGVRYSYKKLLNNIKAINKIKQENKSQIKIKTNSVVLNYNYKNIDELIDLASQNNIKDMQFSLVDAKEYLNNKNIALDKSQLSELYFEIYPKLLEKALNQNIKVEFRPLFTDLVNHSLGELIEELRPSPSFEEEINNYSKGLFGKKFYENYKCHESSKGMVIGPQGDVLYCCSNYRNKIGNIFVNDLEEIIFLKDKTNPVGCDKCRLFFSNNKAYQTNDY
jgi:MoaA/NifB/PqqE/SkfB family radical SAM enzyme